MSIMVDTSALDASNVAKVRESPHSFICGTDGRACFRLLEHAAAPGVSWRKSNWIFYVVFYVAVLAQGRPVCAAVAAVTDSQLSPPALPVGRAQQQLIICQRAVREAYMSHMHHRHHKLTQLTIHVLCCGCWPRHCLEGPARLLQRPSAKKVLVVVAIVLESLLAAVATVQPVSCLHCWGWRVLGQFSATTAVAAASGDAP